MSSAPINSREWWNEYFRETWEQNEGSQQTRHFMNLLLADLDDAPRQFIEEHELEILDWGCAFGDGVAVLAGAFPHCTVRGLDFAAAAVEEARSRYPNQEFIQTPEGEIPRTFDVVVTSNCLEHFSQPLDVLRRHLCFTRYLYLALVPYNERPLETQHAAQFREESFPEAIDGFRRIQCTKVRPDRRFWPNEQLLVAYASPQFGATAADDDTAPDSHATRHRQRLDELERALEARVAETIRERRAREALESRAREAEALGERCAELEREVAALRAARAQLEAQVPTGPSLVVLRTLWRVRKLLLPHGSRRDRSVKHIVGMPGTLVRRARRAAGRGLRRLRERGVRLIPMSRSAFVFDLYRRQRRRMAPDLAGDVTGPGDPDLISVVLPVYNGGPFLRDALDSILAQRYEQFELIVVDDGSTDETPAILEEYAASDPRIRVIHQENQKLPRALNNGFRAARGRWLTWISVDNRPRPEFLQRLVDCLRRHPHWDAAWADLDIIDDDGRPLRGSGWYADYQQPPGSEHIRFPLDPSELNIEANNYVGAAFLYHERAHWLLGPYSPWLFGLEDYDYWMRLNALLTLQHVDFRGSVYEYRFHGRSLTSHDDEIGFTARRPRTMIFDDFRRSFALVPMCCCIEFDEPSAAIGTEVRSTLERRGHRILQLENLQAPDLPRRFIPFVYIRLTADPGAASPPPAGLPDSTLTVLVATADAALPAAIDRRWNCGIAMRTDDVPRLDEDGQGWLGAASLDGLLSALDVRTRAHHARLIEMDAESPPPRSTCASVIICTLHRTDRLMDAIRSVAKQTLPQSEYEVIVVRNDPDDQGPVEAVEELRGACFAAHPERLRLVTCPLLGLSHARNAGIAEAKGDLVLFLDDDALAAHDWIAQMHGAFAEHGELAAIGGSITLQPPDDAPSWLREELWSYWGHFAPPVNDVTRVRKWHEFPWGGNWAARHGTLLRIGGFRTQYGRIGNDYGGGEEVLAGILVDAIGEGVGIAPGAMVRHNPQPQRYSFEYLRRTILAAAHVRYQLVRDGYLDEPTSSARSMARSVRDLLRAAALAPQPPMERRRNLARAAAELSVARRQIADFVRRCRQTCAMASR